VGVERRVFGAQDAYALEGRRRVRVGLDRHRRGRRDRDFVGRASVVDVSRTDERRDVTPHHSIGASRRDALESLLGRNDSAAAAAVMLLVRFCRLARLCGRRDQQNGRKNAQSRKRRSN
jgi:hypothetical protein